MDKEFLEYYRSNLLHIRTLAGEFAKEFPKIAGRLEIGSLETRDPFVERILEGTAFLAARVEKKLDDGFPQLLESILNVVAPDVLSPTPSMAVIELQASKPLEVPAGSEFTCPVPGTATPVRYSTAWSTEISGLRLMQAHYLTRTLSVSDRDESPILASLTLTLQGESGTGLVDCFPKNLDLYLHMESTDASELCRQMMVDLVSVQLRDSAGKVITLPKVQVAMPALKTQGGFTDCISEQMEGIRIFTTAVSFPEGLKFIRISGLQSAMARLRGERVEVVFNLRRRVQGFGHLVDANSIRLGCVPVVNLFRKRSSRALISDAYEIDLYPDRSCPKDYEVWRVNSIEVFNDLNETLYHCYPFFTSTLNSDETKTERNYFNVHRTRRLFSLTNEQNKRLGLYRISNVSVSLSGEQWHERRNEATQLAADLWCTNAELPALLRPDMALNARFLKQVESARFLTAPTEPKEPLVRSGVREDWEKLSYLLLNLSSWLDGRGQIPVKLIRRLVEVWASAHGDESRRLAEGIADVVCRPEMFRFIERGAVFYESGFAVEITLLPEKFEGTGVYTFGCVLKTVLASFTPVNSVVEITLKTPNDGVVTTWKIQEN